MTTPDVNTIVATSSSAINWVTDVIVPLTSALIGGLLALWGVHITLNHDTSDRARTQDELARPFFTILVAGDSRQNAPSLWIFDFKIQVLRSERWIAILCKNSFWRNK